MSDTFFGFNSDLSELGGDKLVGDDEYDYPLLGEHDDEIDRVNNETFGEDIADDWEHEEHERLAGELDGSLKESPELSSKKYQGQEEFMEHSISQLVEDGDDINDPAVMTMSKSRQIPGRSKASLDELFGPASPPAFLDTEHLVSPGKMDIWGSPTRPMMVSEQPDTSGQQLLRMIQTPKPRMQAPPAAMISGHPMSSSLPNAHSVEAIESDLKQMLINKPQGFPLEDLERHMRGTASPLSAMQHGQRMPQLPHGMHTVMGRPAGPERIMHTVMGRGATPERGSPPQFLPNASVPMHMMANRFNTPPPQMFSNQMGMRRMMSPAGPQRIPMHSSYTDPRDMRRQRPMYPRSQMPMRPPMFNNHERAQYQHHHAQYNAGPGDGDRPPYDEYAGIMTQKEKDWVIKIQLIQLHTDNPYIDDYYYTTHSMRKRANETNGNGDRPFDRVNEPKLLLPAIARVETKTYTPVTFEGSLGKLTTSSVHKPRQILDVGRGSSVTEEEEKSGAKDMRKIRKLMIDIEKLYDILLQIDDLEKKVLSMPEEGREPLLIERKESINNMFTQLHCQPDTNEQFVQIACVRKGLKLIGRVLLLLDKVQAHSVVSAVLRNITIIAKKDQQNNTLPTLMLGTVLKIIQVSDFPNIVQFSQDVTQNSGQKSALQNKFGASVIFQLVKRAEVLCQTSEGIHEECRENWSKFLSTVAETVVSLPEKNLAHLLQPCGNVVKQFECVVEGKMLDSLEQKLVVMTGSVEST